MSKRTQARVQFCAAIFCFALVSGMHAQAPQPNTSASTPAQPSAQPAPQAPASPAPAQQDATQPKPARVMVPSGTRLPLVLHNGISTRSAKPGDPVYLETLFPIIEDGHVVIPAGSYVGGEITEAKRPGRVKGRAELMIKLNTLILPNGYMVNLNAIPSNTDSGGGETVNDEGKIKGDTSKAQDVDTVIQTTSIGAGIGGLATRSGKGAGIGAGVGAAAGIIGVLLSRGPEAELPRGTTLDVTLNRPIYLDADKVQFTSTGQASTLPGPSDRQRRTKFPF
jgi:type IV secretion system protein VirB10